MPFFKVSFITVTSVIVGMIALGAGLNFAGRGNMGAAFQKAAQYVTNGYGV